MLKGLALGLASFVAASLLEGLRIEAVRDLRGVALMIAFLLLVMLVVGFGLALLRTEVRGRAAALAVQLGLIVIGASVGDIQSGVGDTMLAFPSVWERGASSFAVAALVGVAMLTLVLPRPLRDERGDR